MAYAHPSQQPQGGSGLPQQVPNANGMMRGQMPQPMGFPHQQGLQNMGNMPMGPMGGAPQMNNAVGAGMNHPGQGMMNTQMVPQVRIYHSPLLRSHFEMISPFSNTCKIIDSLCMPCIRTCLRVFSTIHCLILVLPSHLISPSVRAGHKARAKDRRSQRAVVLITGWVKINLWRGCRRLPQL